MSQLESGSAAKAPITQARESFEILLIVLFYVGSSIALVFLNKFVLNGYNGSGQYDHPLFVTWVQLIVALLILVPLGAMREAVPALSYFRAYEFDLSVAYSVLPVAVVFIGMITFNNICLSYVNVSFYQVARSLTICFSVVFTFTILHTSTSMRAIGAALIVFLGFVLGSISEAEFSMMGVVTGVFASMFVALYGIYVKKALSVVNGDDQRLVLYNNSLGIILFIPLMLLTGEFSSVINDPLTYLTSTWVSLFATGVMGLLINVATYMQIRRTSPLTHAIIGTAKATLQTVLSWMIWTYVANFWSVVSIVLVIGGSFLYSYVRFLEMSKK